MARDPLDDFILERFTEEDVTHPVYRKGTGPGVIVITEVPGITPEVADFARRVVEAGHTVAMPDLFGDSGAPATMPYMGKTIAKACISKEFKVFAAREASPVTDWLRGLGRDLHERAGGPGIGAVGMCLTGNFALAMAVDDRLLAPVLSQPSLPFGATAASRRGLHVSDETLSIVRRRVAEDGLEVLGLRFDRDPFCTRARFDRLDEELGEGFIRVELPSSSANPRGRPMPAHSVLSTDLIDVPGEPTRDALDKVLDLFKRKLLVS